MELLIDGSKINSEEEFHRVVAEGLDFPSWYGKNLSALWDAMTGMAPRPLKIIWVHSELSKTRLPRYEKIVSLLHDVEAQDRQFNRDEVFTLEIR